jgi:hypothetical protein
MVKRKSHSSKKKEKKIHKRHLSEEDSKTEKILIENFVALQRVITHLSEKFDSLATQISKMLNLFEISAKSLAEKEFDKTEDTKDVKKVVEKLDGLLEQNRTIAKGLLLLHEEVSPMKDSIPRQETPSFAQRQEVAFTPRQEVPAFIPRPKPSIPTPERYTPLQAPTPPSERYQKSISSETGNNIPPKPQPPKFKPLTKEGNA